MSNPKSAKASSSRVRFSLSERWLPLGVTSEDKVPRFDLIMAGETGFHEHLVVRRFAVLEVSKPQPPVEAYFFESLTN
jgi:hypothetical protein